MKTMAIVTMGLAALLLGLDKVRNEHRMTEMYERQAVALERIADVVAIREAVDNKHPLSLAVKSYPILPARPKPVAAAASTDGLRFADCVLAIPKVKALTVDDVDRCADQARGVTIAENEAFILGGRRRLPACRQGIGGFPVHATDEELGCRQ
jgi:hypothetical protein